MGIIPNGLQVPGTPLETKGFRALYVLIKQFCNTFATSDVKTMKRNSCEWFISTFDKLGHMEEVYMKKRSLWKRIKYWFDCIMSKGPIAMSLLLFVVTALVVAAIGVFASFVSDDGGVLYQLWSSLMYTLDAGNLAGVPTDNVFYLLLMFLATLCGLFLTSILIGIISASIEDRLSNLRKGTSVVQEEDHTVIIGFDNNIFTILRELIEANSNKKKACIVVLDEKPKEEMESAISSHISNTQTTRIICRSGGIHETYALERCSIETSKSVIINIYNDVETIKVLLVWHSFIKLY